MTASPDTPVGPSLVTTQDAYGVPWTFQRCADGSVRLAVNDSSDPDPTFASITLTPEQWASVVASVSWAGGTNERFRKAHRFHDGDEPADQVEGGGDQ